MSEAAILRAVHLAIGGRPDCRLFRNNVGVALHPDGSRVAYGLCPGSADLIGWRSVLITPEMAGLRLAQFLALEVKTATGRPTTGQRAFLAAVEAAGGLAAVVRSPADAEEVLALLSLPGR